MEDEIIIWVMAIIVGVALWIGGSQIIYGDWTCSFKECVVIKGDER